VTAFVRTDIPLVEELDRLGAESLTARVRRDAKVRAPRKAKRATPERDQQRAVVAWLRKAGCIVQATFTEQAATSRDKAKRARFGAARKASGATTGFPDLTVVTPSGRVLFVEMKAPKGELSDAQAEIHAEMRARGCVVLLGRDIWSVQQGMAEAGVTLVRAGAATGRAIPLVEGGR
jgi:hypothetical protein